MKILKIATVVIVLGAALFVSTSSASAHGFPRHCGDQPGRGAGWFDVRSYQANCHLARAVADYFVWESGGDHRFFGWRCDSDRLGLELSNVDCKSRRRGFHQHVRFRFGA